MNFQPRKEWYLKPTEFVVLDLELSLVGLDNTQRGNVKECRLHPTQLAAAPAVNLSPPYRCFVPRRNARPFFVQMGLNSLALLSSSLKRKDDMLSSSTIPHCQ